MAELEELREILLCKRTEQVVHHKQMNRKREEPKFMIEKFPKKQFSQLLIRISQCHLIVCIFNELPVFYFSPHHNEVTLKIK
ncbi:CLUMA_CG006374, isoform A [Clunio marinus]|uniref:CLUMA_CG006374, isoform A n=1 Tax=Clunio marinus TaxID=568069 RepID=A0A1J1HXK4_9DIPT|nr:CLUMA_CG006374, isoform A [Clunio marinus]